MTPVDLQTAALRELKVVSATDQPSSEDTILMAERYTALHAMLLERELVIWAVDEDIPAKCAQPVIMLLAAFSANQFGVPEPTFTQVMLAGTLDAPSVSLAERQLRKSLAPKYVSYPVRTEYF